MAALPPFYVIATVDQKWFYSLIASEEASHKGLVATVLQEGYDEEVPAWQDGEIAHTFLDELRKKTTKYELIRGLNETSVSLDEPPDLIVLHVKCSYVFTPFAADPHRA